MLQLRSWQTMKCVYQGPKARGDPDSWTRPNKGTRDSDTDNGTIRRLVVVAEATLNKPKTCRSVGWRRARSARSKSIGGRKQPQKVLESQSLIKRASRLGNATRLRPRFPNELMCHTPTRRPILGRTLDCNDPHGKRDEGEQPCDSRTLFVSPRVIRPAPCAVLAPDLQSPCGVRCLIGFAHS
jgi:hypothetical protein